MAWPFDNNNSGGGNFNFATPEMSSMMLGNYGGNGNALLPNLTSDAASGAQNLSSISAATGLGNAPAAGSSLFGSIGDLFSKNSLFGGTDERGVTTKGWAPVALGIGQALFSGIQGQQSMKLAQNQLKEQKRQFDQNYAAQRQSINTDLEDRQRARVASNPGAYESVSSYLAKNRIR